MAKRTRAGSAHRAASRDGGGDTAQIVQGLRRIVKALHTYSQEVLAAYALTGPQLWALKTLRQGGPLTVGQLATSLAVHQSSISILLDRLEKRGLVRRLRGRPDRRVGGGVLTKRGAAPAGLAPRPGPGRPVRPPPPKPVPQGAHDPPGGGGLGRGLAGSR